MAGSDHDRKQKLANIYWRLTNNEAKSTQDEWVKLATNNMQKDLDLSLLS